MSQEENREVTVNIRCSIISVGDIDTVRQEFKCDIFVCATWREPRLQGKENKDVDWSEEWNPRITFFNAVSIDSNQKKRNLIYLPGDDVPLAQESYRLVGTFKENLELYDFPMDCQELTVTLMSDWTDRVVEFRKDMTRMDNVRHETFTAVHEWELGDHVATEATRTKDNQASSANNYPIYHIRAHVRRKNGYYLWNVVTIMLLIGALAFASFSVDISAPADRLSVTLTLLLTAVAFKFVVSQSLPTISYLTILDKYVLAVLVFLCGVAVENAVAAAISRQSVQKLFDRICLYVFVGIYVLIHIIGLIVVIIKTRGVSQRMANLSRAYKDRSREIAGWLKKAEKEKLEQENKPKNTIHVASL
ncbi:cys-loop ligand-gated ion channel isoform X2 [Nematostella vectensis]|uniref:cys-loop ligand-gated ion channel isoform X2 n=1 Tax=Nematostella vectensis TaxID=45351 RepID=UPI002076E097|nr:cys-loop ligand-gated ion channel isoform X2 [Nematostella vectensis]